MKKELKLRLKLYRSGKLEGYKKSIFGLIPKEWEEGKLSDFIKNLDSGISLNCDSRQANDGEIGILKTSAVGSKGFNPKQNKVIFELDKNRVKVKVKKDHILIVRKNTPELVGSACYVDKDYNNLYLPDLLWQTDFKNKMFNKKWLFYFFNTKFYKNAIKLIATGSSDSMPNITKTDLLKINICIPEYNEQNRIANIISTWDKAIKLKERLIEIKIEQKKGVMKKLLTGEVRFPGLNSKWNEVSLKNILKQRKEKSEITDDLKLFSLTIEDGVTPKTDRYNRDFLVKSTNKNYKITRKNDIVYNPANLRYGAIALNTNENPVLVSPIYEILYLDNERYDINFMAHLLTWDRNIKYYGTKAEGTLVERKSVKVDNFLNLSFRIPMNVEEQMKISKVLDDLNVEINLLKKEVLALGLQKKELIQLLFTGAIRVNN